MNLQRELTWFRGWLTRRETVRLQLRRVRRRKSSSQQRESLLQLLDQSLVIEADRRIGNVTLKDFLCVQTVFLKKLVEDNKKKQLENGKQ